MNRTNKKGASIMKKHLIRILSILFLVIMTMGLAAAQGEEEAAKASISKTYSGSRSATYLITLDDDTKVTLTGKITTDPGKSSRWLDSVVRIRLRAVDEPHTEIVVTVGAESYGYTAKGIKVLPAGRYKLSIETDHWSYKITVSGVKVKAPELSVKSLSLCKGQKRQVTVKNANGKKAVWSSSNPNVAAVSSSGIVTGRNAGNAVITCRIAGKKLTLKVSVIKEPVTMSFLRIGSRYSSYAEGYVKVTNKSNKTIRRIELDLIQYDQYGNQVRYLNAGQHYQWCNVTISPGQTYTNRFFHVHRNTVRFTIKIRQVTFVDGTTWKP